MKRNSLMAQVKQTRRMADPLVSMLARRYLLDLYTRMLDKVALAPEIEPYRECVEEYASERLRICREEVDLSMIEKRIDCGPIPNLITQARIELHQVNFAHKRAPWLFGRY
ncbi:ETC complex I subunit [Parasponia andersonii]|uniref:ETC complex I subunit n=1 Tax=Parasponia andersonii TaxID=3476 RepID=A0A2P5B1B4_PARAD|nr:ETC complex I subunit [Parasponia andersonii]